MQGSSCTLQEQGLGLHVKVYSLGEGDAVKLLHIAGTGFKVWGLEKRIIEDAVELLHAGKGYNIVSEKAPLVCCKLRANTHPPNTNVGAMWNSYTQGPSHILLLEVNTRPLCVALSPNLFCL
jgi:hypothetical protein